jgi:hypothetical protein
MGQRYQYERSSVPVERSREAINRLLTQHGATTRQWTEAEGIIQLQFAVRYVIDKKDMILPVRIRITTKGKKEQSVYRALLNNLLAKWTAIDFGIETLQEAFLPWVMMKLPGGGETTVGEKLLPHLRRGDLPDFQGLSTALLTEGGK